jgi:hypothetical protein
VGVSRPRLPVIVHLLRLVRFVLPSATVTFLLMQLVPYRITNLPTRLEPKWDSARTRQLTFAACYDCGRRRPVWGAALVAALSPLTWRHARPRR